MENESFAEIFALYGVQSAGDIDKITDSPKLSRLVASLLGWKPLTVEQGEFAAALSVILGAAKFFRPSDVMFNPQGEIQCPPNFAVWEQGTKLFERMAREGLLLGWVKDSTCGDGWQVSQVSFTDLNSLRSVSGSPTSTPALAIVKAFLFRCAIVGKLPNSTA